MWIPLVFAVAFALGAVVNAFGPHPDPANAVVGFAVACLLYYVWLLLSRDQAAEVEFYRWLGENQDAIRSGKAAYEGILITGQTELRQYQLAMSFLIVSLKQLSRPYIVGHETKDKSLVFTLSSLLLGWWGFPWGPIYTIGAVATNLRGGVRRSVSDLLDELNGHQRDLVQLTERAAENAKRIMSERGFPAGSALQVEVTGDPGSGRYRIVYDEQPPSNGSVWRSQLHGVPVIVRKEIAPRMAGLVVDFDGGDFVFTESETGRLPAIA